MEYEDPLLEPTEAVWVCFFREARKMGPGGTVLATVSGPGV